MAKRVVKKAAVRTPVKRAPAAKKGVAKEATVKKATMKRAASKREVTSVTSVRVSVPARRVKTGDLAHQLDALLHTMQMVQNYEETLCSLKHALQRGRANGTLLRELREVLDELPAHDYLYEVDLLRRSIAA